MKRRATTSLTLCALVILALAVLRAEEAAAWTSLLENGSLETDENQDGIADGWHGNIHPGAEGGFEIDRAEKTEGAASQKIIHSSDNAEWVRISQMPIGCRREASYRFDCDVKSTCRYCLLVYEFVEGGKYITHNLGASVAGGWEHKSGIIKTTKAALYLKVSLITESKGEAWFDNVSLICLEETPSVIVPPARTPPTIDGKLDDACWRGAAEIAPFFLLGGGGATSAVRTTAWICQDDDALYVAFKCSEPQPSKIKARHREHDAPIHSDDCVEVFLSTRDDENAYFHFSVNALGTRYDKKHEPRTMVFNRTWYGADPGAPVNKRPAWNPEWKAAALVGKDEWCAEMAIPFSQMNGPPGFGEVRRANFCRERKVAGEENSSWVCMQGDTFHQPAQFGYVVFGGGKVPPPEIVPPVKERPSLVIVPHPQQIRPAKSDFALRNAPKILALKKSAAVSAAVELLAGDLSERFGLKLTSVSGAKQTGSVVLDHEPLAEETVQALKQHGMTLPDDPEGYVLIADRDGVLLAGKAAKGVFYGMQTLRQMVFPGEDGPVVRGAEISDHPDMRMRSWHSACPIVEDVEDYKRLLDTLALLKFNTVMIEINDKLKYERHPDISSSGALSKEQLREIAAYARNLQFEVIPQVQTLGHFGYVLNKPGYGRLSETAEPKPGRGFWAYCPSNPDVYPLVFDLFTEVIETVEPKRYFHIGHDEFTFVPFGRCERCKNTPPEQLFAREVKKLHDWLAERNLKTLMWGDELLQDQHGKMYDTYKATPLIPKDIIICDWHYAPWDEFPSLEYFKDNGFQTIACGWYNVRNVYNFTRAAKKVGNMGYSGTTWYGIGRIAVTPDLMAGICLTAENTWSNWNPALDKMPYHPTDRFRALYDIRKKPAPAREFFVVDISRWCNRDLSDNERKTQCFGLGPDNDLSPVPKGRQDMRGIPFLVTDPGKNDGKGMIMLCGRDGDGLPQKVWQIGVGAKARSLIFLHTTTRTGCSRMSMYERLKREPKNVGRYVVHFEDGSKEIVPLVYRRNIVEWNNRLATGLAPIVWTGATRAGSLIQLCAFEWANPKPNVAIRAVDFESTVLGVSPVLIAISGKR